VAFAVSGAPGGPSSIRTCGDSGDSASAQRRRWATNSAVRVPRSSERRTATRTRRGRRPGAATDIYSGENRTPSDPDPDPLNDDNLTVQSAKPKELLMSFFNFSCNPVTMKNEGYI
jgi:hypothetical protein